MKCTWKDCTEEASYLQIDKKGKEWSHLCEKHHKELETTLEEFLKNGSPKKLLSVWVKAKGGAKVATDQLLGEDDG